MADENVDGLITYEPRTCPSCQGPLASEGHVDARDGDGHFARWLFECDSCGQRFFADGRPPGFRLGQQDLIPVSEDDQWPPGR
jgi:hypothetical protein